MSPPSSGSKIEPSKEPAWSRWQALQHQLAFTELNGVISQKNSTGDSMFTSKWIAGRARPLLAVQTSLLIAVGARHDAVAPQLSSRGWVDPVPDPLLLRKSGSAELWPLDHRHRSLPKFRRNMLPPSFEYKNILRIYAVCPFGNDLPVYTPSLPRRQYPWEGLQVPKSGAIKEFTSSAWPKILNRRILKRSWIVRHCTALNATRMAKYTEQSTRKATSGKEFFTPSRSVCGSFG
jgi:hypothetical protein